MESINIVGILEVFRAFGLVGVIVMIWYFDSKNLRKILEKYKSDMIEQRKMYESNVKLVQGYESLAHDLKDVVIMNTQAMQRISDSINTNQYCPMVRLEKQAKGKQG